MKKKFKNEEIQINDRDKHSGSFISDTMCISEEIVDSKLNISDKVNNPACKDDCENLNNELKVSKSKEFNINEILSKKKDISKEFIVRFKDEGTISSEEIDKDDILIKKDQDLSDLEKDEDSRRIRINNFGTCKIEIPFSKINSVLYLPHKMKKISQLYKIIETIHNFNANRNLSLVFVKYCESIERLFKHRVEMVHLEILNYFCGDDILFQPITVMDKGCLVETYTIKIVKKVDIDKRLFDYLMSEYSRWLDSNNIKGSIKRFHPDFNIDIIEMPTRSLPKINTNFSSVSEKSVDLNDLNNESKNNLKCKMKDNETFYEECKKKIRLEANNIFERIRKKEEERKRMFFQENLFKPDYERKIKDIFNVSNKKAIKLKDLLFQINGDANSKEEIIKNINGDFYIKEIDGCKYVIRNG